MRETQSAYPLQWPAGRPRSVNREWSRFKVTALGRVRDDLRAELDRLGARQIVVSTNRPLRNDGEFYANSSEPDDPAVAVYFTLKGRPMCFACDRWRKMAENIWAIVKTIEALRGIDRWGVGEAMERAFTGFEALPPPEAIQGARQQSWWDILGIPRESKAEEIRARRIELAKRFHPDAGTEPSHEKMTAVNGATEDGLREKRTR